MYLIFDTETTGLPRDWNAPITDSDNWPRCVQIAWQLHNDLGDLVEVKNYIIKPEGYDIPFNAAKIHGITTERAQKQGVQLDWVLGEFNKALEKSTFVVGHNIGFDIHIMGAEFYRKSVNSNLSELKSLDTCTEVTAELCKIPGGKGGKFKLPKLEELHQFLFNEDFAEAHNASADVEATTRCFLELVRKQIFSETDLSVSTDYFTKFNEHNPHPFELIGLNIQPYSQEDIDIEDLNEISSQPNKGLSHAEIQENLSDLKGAPFTHLHNHTQFSVLQSTSQIEALVEAAVSNNMPAVAITDSANMMGAFQFVNSVTKHNQTIEKENQKNEKDVQYVPKRKLKPIVGCEFYICRDHTDKANKDNGYQVVFLAKNKKGYQNLSKLSSFAHVNGFYYVPRIDKELVTKYKEDIVVLSGGTNGEIPNLILNVGEKQAEEALIWWKEQFKDDFYIELLRHDNSEAEKHLNNTLVSLAKKHQVKVVAANNTFYIHQEDADAHDILLCVRDGERQSTPIGRGRGFRFGMPNNEFYFKSTQQMKELFKDVPDAIFNTQEIVNKIEPFELVRDVLLPKFSIPKEFQDTKDEEDGGKRGENNYLRFLTYKGAEERYSTLSDEIKERLDFELETIERTGYPGYFLIVQDFIAAAREMGVSVGPGRGSAAGSAVAYCLKITNIDPIKYDLLFERFLNPDRVSLPDIDIDFDDEGRGKVIDWVIKKYGENQVAQIITYGTMAAKSSIRDTARALDLPLAEAGRLANLVPGIKLNKIFELDEKGLKEKLTKQEEVEMALELKKIAGSNSEEAKVVNKATILEGSLRNTGIHACGVIITPDDITNFVPVAKAKDSDMYVTQFDNAVVESAGLLKMDFLGLKTLTLIKDTCKLIKHIHGIELDPETFPLEDEKTYELFQRGETVGIFQYESPGMQKYMRELKPTVFADLIAMNALYRPGPLAYIPSFIDRKHGREEIKYDVDACEEYLAETYGITVYQEQVMLLSQKLANFTKGEADVLRKAMGKKIFALLEQLKPKFINGGVSNGHDEKTLEKIWKDWEAFAAYAFNKSHSTCYAWIAYQTAYLKAHYPAEYMAAVLSNNMRDIKSITFFMEECKRMGLNVLGPDVNESFYKFTVNKEGAIRFGMGAIKGVGEGAVETIVKNRLSNGKYGSIFDMASRIDLRAANKRTLENLAYAGAFDSFGGHRAQYFSEDGGKTAIETAIKYGNSLQEQENSTQTNLFGLESDNLTAHIEPQLPKALEWGTIYTLNQEKEVVGIYISGHPLDDFKFEIENFCVGNATYFNDIENHIGKDLSLAGIITSAEHRVAKNGNPFGIFEFEDYEGGFKQFLFKEDYLKNKHYLVTGNFLFIKGKVERKRWGDMAPEFKIQSIELLTEVKNKLGKTITITIPSAKITKPFVDQILELFEEKEDVQKGICQLKVCVTDNHKTKVNLFSRSIKLNLTKNLIKHLNELEDISYKIN